ncbi:tetratricopeptide repeat protein [Thalassospira sp.]|uniref:tetratricopeptide repeat protein n=1 Tax=Thalassospira sp. TaxID=1912094 RepID=UPI003AA7B81A
MLQNCLFPLTRPSRLSGKTRRTIVLAAPLLVVLCLGFSQNAHADYKAGYLAYKAGNFRNAQQEWQDAASTDPRAAYALGLLYYRGKLGGEDYENAAKWFSVAARANHPNALYYMGLLYLNGWGVNYDQFKATDFLKRAFIANGKNADAAFLLGEQYMHGRGAMQNYVDAAHYYLKAAQEGLPAGQYMIGAMYERGWGVDPDLAEAYYWLRLSALKPINTPPGTELEADPGKAIAQLEQKLRPEEIRHVEDRLGTAIR